MAVTDPYTTGEQMTSEFQATSPRSMRIAILLTVVSAIALGAASFALIRGELSTASAEAAAVGALLAFCVLVYGVLRMILVVVESAGERRRQAREITERRQGDRARQPR